MVKYHGGKVLVKKEISHIIYQYTKDKKYNFYCEPFLGYGSVLFEVINLYDNKLNYYGGDINKSIILMWQALKNNWSPPAFITEEQYKKIKDGKDTKLLGYSINFTTRGVYRSNYTKSNKQRAENIRNEMIAKGNIMKKYDVKLHHGSYEQYSNFKNTIFYCDIPYKNTTTEYIVKDFDHEKFREWCLKMKHKNNIIFISSYEKPFKETNKIWESNKTNVNFGVYTKPEKLYLVV